LLTIEAIAKYPFESLSRKTYLSWVEWLTPVTPGTQEVEIGRIIVLGHPGQKVHETLYQLISWV
jgi:hypothetical protein